MLRCFKSQEILVNGGCSSSISKVQLSSNVFVKHDDAACRKIAQGGFTIETSSKNSPARLGNKVSLLRQRYERRGKQSLCVHEQTITRYMGKPYNPSS